MKILASIERLQILVIVVIVQEINLVAQGVDVIGAADDGIFRDVDKSCAADNVIDEVFVDSQNMRQVEFFDDSVNLGRLGGFGEVIQHGFVEVTVIIFQLIVDVHGGLNKLAFG